MIYRGPDILALVWFGSSPATFAPLSRQQVACLSQSSWEGSGRGAKSYAHTVTRIDVIFRYPDRVPLTHFVHRAKKVFSMWAWIFCWVFCATWIFRRCNGKVLENRVGANLQPLDYEPGVLPLRHCSLVCKMQWHSVCSLLGFSGHFCSYRKPNFPAISGSSLPGFSGGICSYWQPNFPAISVVTCRDFPALPFLAPEGRNFPAVSLQVLRAFGIP